MKKIIIIISGIILALAVVVLIVFLYTLNHKGRGELKEFIVRGGQTTREIAHNLEKDNLISSALVFEIYAKLKGELIQVGVYKLSPEQSLKEIFNILAQGKASEYLVTIPEGWRAIQIDEYLGSKQIIKAGDLIKIASADEGYLFPDTYRFLPDSDAQEIRKTMLDNFKKKTAGLAVTREVVILASIVEREAKFDEDRAKIAGVYFNRLQKEMRLEADPTVQYAKGSWEPIRTADYRNVVSPYNTYLYFGLPPGPICNPGLKSIQAVLAPEKNGWFYFFHLEDGQTVYSTTIEEHQENLKQYQ